MGRKNFFDSEDLESVRFIPAVKNQTFFQFYNFNENKIPFSNYICHLLGENCLF